jgi:hypothetical protein
MTDPDVLEPLTEILRSRGGLVIASILEPAWPYLARNSVDGTRRLMAPAIGHVATMHGVADRSHDTITSSWVILVAIHRRRDAGATFDDFIATCPALLDRHLLDRHYSLELLTSASARRHWTIPDLRPLPALA